MKKNYAKTLAICITAAMVLNQPAAVFAANQEQIDIIQEMQDGKDVSEDTEESSQEATEDGENDEKEQGKDISPVDEVGDEKEDSAEDNGETGDQTKENKEDVNQTEENDIEQKTIDGDSLDEDTGLQVEADQKNAGLPQSVDEEANVAVTAVNGEWNVQDFGAGKGGDDAYAINQALAAVTSQAPVVRIPKGSYTLSSGLKVTKDNTRIVFDDGAELVGTSAAEKAGAFLIQGRKGITIENPVIKNMGFGLMIKEYSSDIHVKGGKIQPVSTGVGIQCDSASDITVDGLMITGSKLGILINGGSTFTISGCIIESQSQGDIWALNGTNGINIKNNLIKSGATSGIWLEESNNVTISDNDIQQNGTSSNDKTYGIKLISSKNVTIQKNNINDNKSAGINVDRSSSAVRVLSNNILRNGGIGVCVGSVGSGSSVEVSNNTIRQNSQHGIILISSYGTIKNNTVDGTNSVGSVDRANHYGIIINCRNAADKANTIEVSGNTVTGMTGNGIQVTGDKTKPNNEGAINVNVTSNQVSNVGDNGITVNYNSHNAMITSNTVNGAKVNGIDIQGGSQNCKVNYNIINNCSGMGISIGSKDSGGGAEIIGNRLEGNKDIGIHVTHSTSKTTISDNKVTNHFNKFSIAVVNGAKTSIKSNVITLPADYIGKNANVYPYAIFVGDGTTTTNGAVRFNFKPNAVATGATQFTGTGTPGLTIVLDMNGSVKNTKTDAKWNYSIACSTLKTSDAYSISAKDAYGNMITYSNRKVSNSVDETKVKKFVERMYTVALNRTADTAGCNFWMNLLVTGAKDGASVAKGFVLSNEMEKRKLNDDQYVTMLYKTFFDREPSANDSGKAFWINLLQNGVTRAYVFRGFCHSQEFTNICANYGITRGEITLTDNCDQNHNITMYVYRCYNRTLGRKPDAKGMSFWTGQILKKQRNASEVAANFVFSTEFKNKNLSDEEFVKIMYRMFFDREYNAPGTDPNGINFWLNELKSGRRDRYGVFTGFVNSQEFKNVLKTFGL